MIVLVLIGFLSSHSLLLCVMYPRFRKIKDNEAKANAELEAQRRQQVMLRQHLSRAFFL